ncbi:hypothetical protein J437_LFUL005470, partial [Ladona fulva]
PVAAVHITALRVPAVVRNGSHTGALLDCEYALGAREQRRLASETGLVVKWFLVGSGPAPVYQWIPGQRPQDFGDGVGRERSAQGAEDPDANNRSFRRIQVLRFNVRRRRLHGEKDACLR